jgi:hypothetical protein
MWPPLPASVTLVATWCGCFGKYHYKQDACENPKPDDCLVVKYDFTS